MRVERRDLLSSVDPSYLIGKERAGVGAEHELINRAFQRYPEASREEATILGTKRCFPQCSARCVNANEILEASGDLDQYRMFLILATALCNQRGSIGLLVGGGLAKNPADAPTRRLLFQQFRIGTFAHYLNLRQLFEGASSRVSFVVITGSRQSLCRTQRLPSSSPILRIFSGEEMARQDLSPSRRKRSRGSFRSTGISRSW